MACGEAVRVPSSMEGKSSPMVRTAGIARSIMDCLLKNNGYWTVPVSQSCCANPRLSRAAGDEHARHLLNEHEAAPPQLQSSAQGITFVLSRQVFFSDAVFAVIAGKMIPMDPKNGMGRRVSRFCTICIKNQLLNTKNENLW